MATERIKGGVAFYCDLKGCNEGIETGEKNFGLAQTDARSNGWQFRNRDGVWKHFCCARHEEMDYRGQSIVSEKKT